MPQPVFPMYSISMAYLNPSSIPHYTVVAADATEPWSGFELLWNVSIQSEQLHDPSGGSFIGGFKQYLKGKHDVRFTRIF